MHERGGELLSNTFMESCIGTLKTELELVEYATGPGCPGSAAGGNGVGRI